MEGKLTTKEMRALIASEKSQINDNYRDEIDITIGQLLNLYENKKIDEATLELMTSLVISATLKETVSELKHNLLLKKNFLNTRANDTNKLLLVNYSKESYA